MECVKNVPPVSDIREAIKIYYERTALGTSDIMVLFNVKRNKALTLKKAVQNEMIKKEMLFLNSTCVDTETAFNVWGIDIANLEKRLSKLKKFELLV